MSSGSCSSWTNLLLPIVALTVLENGTKEACGESGTNNLPFNGLAVSLTSICSFPDELGYQGSQEPSSEEDSDSAVSKKPKRKKATVVRVRKNEVREEDKEDEEDDAKIPPYTSKSPRLKRRQFPNLRTCQMPPTKHMTVLEGNLSSSSDESKLSCWSLAMVCQSLCSCCYKLQKSMEDSKISGSGQRTNLNKTE